MKRIVVTLAALLLSGCISRELRAVDDARDTGTQTIVIAHLGASAAAPVGTLAAFDKAQQLGANAIELDLQLSKDGRVVVFGDETLAEKTSLKGSVRDHAWDDLAKVDLAPWFARTHAQTTGDVKAMAANTPSRVELSGKAGGRRKSAKRSSRKKIRERLPTDPLTHLATLDDVFERYGMTFSYFLELKSDDPKLAEAASQLMREYALESNVTFTSFHFDDLMRAQKLTKDLPLIFEIDPTKTPDLDGELARARTNGLTGVSVRASVISSDFVRRVHESKLTCFVWGAQSEEEMKRAAQSGADGIMTDEPDRLLKILKAPRSR